MVEVSARLFLAGLKALAKQVLEEEAEELGFELGRKWAVEEVSGGSRVDGCTNVVVVAAEDMMKQRAERRAVVNAGAEADMSAEEVEAFAHMDYTTEGSLAEDKVALVLPYEAGNTVESQGRLENPDGVSLYLEV